MNRRDALRTLAGVSVLGLAGCTGPAATGEVARNDTALTVTDHRAGFRATGVGTELYVELDARNDGDVAVTPSGDVPRFSCAFFTDGEELYTAAKQMTRSLDPKDTREFTFELHRRADEADRYELAVETVTA